MQKEAPHRITNGVPLDCTHPCRWHCHRHTGVSNSSTRYHGSIRLRSLKVNRLAFDLRNMAGAGAPHLPPAETTTATRHISVSLRFAGTDLEQLETTCCENSFLICPCTRKPLTASRMEFRWIARTPAAGAATSTQESATRTLGSMVPFACGA